VVAPLALSPPLRPRRHRADAMGEDADEEPVAVEMSEAAKTRISDVFTRWDIMGDGLIPIEVLPKIKCGPRTFDVTGMLNKMDTNGDGKVEKSEWEHYWKMITATTGEATLNTAIDEIDNDEMIATVRGVMLKKQFDAGVGVAPDEEEGEEEEEEEVLELSEERAKKCDELFNSWDPKGTGKIMLNRMKAAVIKVGPTNFNPSEAFAQMDTNDDGSVTKDELRAYFAALNLNDATFDLILSEMTEVAKVKVALDENLEYAMASVQMGAFNDDEFDADAPDERKLSDKQNEQLKALFCSLGTKDSLDEEIDIKHCQKSATTSAGPLTFNVFEMLPQMDANSDGKLEFSELEAFLTQMMRALPPTDFDVLLEEMVENARAAKTIKMLETMDM